MSRDTTDLASAVRRYAAECRDAAGPHPDREELVAYDRGELGEDRQAKVQEHLALCPECTLWLLDYGEFDRREGEGAGDAVAAAWRRQRGTAWDEVQRRIGALEEPAESPSGEPRSVAVRRVAPPAIGAHPVARWLATAVLAAACVVLAVLLWRAREEVQRPRPVTMVSLTPAGSGTLRGGEAPGRLVIRPPRGNRVVVLLAYAGVGDEVRFAAEIDPPTGEGPPRLVEVTRRSDEAFAVGLGTDPAPGRYRIVLYALEGDGLRELAIYEFRLGVAEPDESYPSAPPSR